MRALTVLAPLLVGLLTHATRARAEEPPRADMRLEVQQSPETASCRFEPRLRGALTRALGHDPVDPSSTQQLRISVFALSSREIAAYLELRLPDGSIAWQRVYQRPAGDCAGLVESSTLGLEVALASQQSPAPATSAEPCPPPAPCPLPAPCPPPARCAPCRSCPKPAARRAPEAISWSGSLGAEVVFGPLPGVTGGGMLGVAVRTPLIGVSLEGRVSGPAVSEMPGGELLAWLSTASLVPCLRLWALDACAVGSIGALHGLGRGIDMPDRVTIFYVAGGPRLAGLIPISQRFLLRPYVDVAIPLMGISLNIGDERVWTVPPAGAVVGISMVMPFSAPR